MCQEVYEEASGLLPEDAPRLGSIFRWGVIARSAVISNVVSFIHL